MSFKTAIVNPVGSPAAREVVKLRTSEAVVPLAAGIW
jgi:hypothetical protein